MVIEALSDIATNFDMLNLIQSDRDDLRVVDQDIRSLQPAESYQQRSNVPAPLQDVSDFLSDYHEDRDDTPNNQANQVKPIIINREGGQSYSPSEEVEESLSLEENEKDLIHKALIKHKGRRKEAAQDLGISERTLYRKIKQYEL